MKRVLRYVFERKRAFNRLPFFEWMRDETLSPRTRLAFYPAMAPFILSFGDLNRIVLRRDAADDPYQQIVNQHTIEDDHHWPWYLEDLTKLGYDDTARGSNWMRFLWGEETIQNRVVMAELTALITPATGMDRLVIIESIEEVGNVLFGTMLPLTERIERDQGQQLRYCGSHHFRLGSAHAVGADHKALKELHVPDEQQVRYRAMVDKVFDVFEAWTNELLRYAQAHPPASARVAAASRDAVAAIVKPGTGISAHWAFDGSDVEIPPERVRAAI